MSAKFRYMALYDRGQDGTPEEERNNAAMGYVKAYHKRPWEHAPFRIPNEYVCSRLAEFIGLPTPPCVLTFSDIDGAPVIFSSLNFNAAKDNPPPVYPDICVSCLPRECTGVLLFDIWIANEDRHDENLAVDEVAAPTKMMVFDHDMALLGGSRSGHTRSIGIERLKELKFARLGVTGSTMTGGSEHCFLREINTSDHFDEWVQRIGSVPRHFIEKLCEDLVRVDILERGEAAEIVDFLEFRKTSLASLIESHRTEFSAITQWTPPGSLF